MIQRLTLKYFDKREGIESAQTSQQGAGSSRGEEAVEGVGVSHRDMYPLLMLK